MIDEGRVATHEAPCNLGGTWVYFADLLTIGGKHLAGRRGLFGGNRKGFRYVKGPKPRASKAKRR